MSNSLSTLSRWVFGGLIAFSSAALTGPLVGQEPDQEERRRGRPGMRDGDRGGPRGDRGRGGLRGERGPEDRGPEDRGPEGRPGGPPFGGPEMMMRLPVIAALDANKDGVISKSEIENAAVALRKLDQNKDGKIDAEEMRPSFGGRGFAGSGPPRRGPDQGRPGDEDRGEGRPGGPDRGERGPEGRRPGGERPGGERPGAERAGAGRGAAMLDRIMSQDKDGDGLLSGDEIPERMARMVDRADKNGDKKLSREEIQSAMMDRPGGARRGEGGPGRGRGEGGPGRRRGEGDAPGGEKPKRPPSK